MSKQKPVTLSVVKTMGTALPEVVATTNWAGRPVLKARGCFMAVMASHASAETDTLIVRCELEDRERMLAPRSTPQESDFGIPQEHARHQDQHAGQEDRKRESATRDPEQAQEPSKHGGRILSPLGRVRK